MRQEILKGALLTQHREAGLRLTQPRAHLLCLETIGGSSISYFDSKGATVEDIRKTADDWMKETDSVSYIEPVMKFSKLERPFYDKKVTMQNFIDFLTEEKHYIPCPKCGKSARIRPYGDGYVATCCGQVIYNAKKLPEVLVK